jgi:hypothetical protein
MWVFAVVSALSFVLYAKEGPEAVPTATISVESSQSLYQNGDVISIKGENFAASDKIKSIIMLKNNDISDNWQEYVLMESYDLSISPLGDLSGTITVDGLDVNDKMATLWIVLKNGSVVVSQDNFGIIGDNPEKLFGVLAGTFTISDSTGGLFVTDDTASVSGSGFDNNESIVFSFIQEFDADDNLQASNAPASTKWSVDGSGNFSGSARRGGSAFDVDAVKIRIFVFFGGSSGAVTSSNSIPIAEGDPPGLLSAVATSLDTILLTFDEPVSEDGNAHSRFGFSGAQAGTTAASDLIAVGSQPTATWKLYLSPPLANRGVGDVTIAYTQSASGDTLYDAAGNQVEDTSPDSAVVDSIVPGATSLRESTNTTALTLSVFIGSSGYTLRARVTDGINDSSLDGVLFEGSDNGTTWSSTGLGTDATATASGSDADFDVSWTSGTNQYKMLRARAFDDAGAGGADGGLDSDDNITTSAVVGSAIDGFNDNFEDTYRAIITSVTPDPVTASSGSSRSEITVRLEDNYGNKKNTTGSNNTFRFRESTTTTETWWDASSGGTGSSTQIDTTVSSSNDSVRVWYSNNVAGGPNTLVLTEPAGNFAANNGVVSANSETITVTTGTASKIWIRFAGQTFTSGTGVTGTPNSHLATDTLIAKLFVTDDANNLASTFSETRTVDFTTTASNAPDGTQPSVSHLTTLTNISVDFTNGVDTVTVRYPNAETGVTLTADDPGGSPALTGVTSSGVDINPGALEQFAFVMATPQRDGQAVTGTNTLTAQDTYENVITTFDASLNNVTITGSGSGTATITGLGSGDNNVLNQAADFTNGVANLTSQAMVIDVTITGVYSFTATSADSKTGTASNIAVNKLVTVSGPNTGANTLIDTTGTATDFLLSASLSGTEDAVDDFRIRWGFNTSGTAGSYFLTRQSTNLTPGATIQYTLPVDSVKELSAPADYMFWWVENISTDPAATILEGLPTSGNPRRLILNPNLITEAGIGGGDVAQGDFSVGVTNQEVVSILFKSDPSPATIRITSLTFDKTGSAGTNDIGQFHLYLDGGTLGTYDSGTDVLLKDFTFTGGTSVTFSDISNLNISGTSNYILVTVDVKAGATPTNTLGLNLDNPASISLDDNVFNGPASSITKNSFSNLGTSQDYSLPVDLASFVASAAYGKVVLEWETASEVNNEGFFIYRSSESDGFFEALNSDIISGNGNSNTSQTYRFEDKNVVEGETYFYKLYSRDFNGQINEYPSIVSATVLEVPRSFQIEQNYPNPFNPSTRFSFSIAEPSQASLIVYNVLGQKIRTIFDNNFFEPGVYEEFFWDATDDAGNTVANGVYYYEFRVLNKNVRQVKKMLYLK